MIGHPDFLGRSLRGSRLLAVLFVVAILAMAAAGLVWTPAAQAAGEAVTYEPEEVSFVSLLNWYRFTNGLEPLMVSDTVTLACDRHSSDMAKYNFFDHYTPAGKSDWFPAGSAPWDRMRLCGYTGATWMAENIAAGQITGQVVFDAWRTSAPHNSTMLSPSPRVLGVSLVPVTTGYRYYWTTDFGNYVDATAHWVGNVPYQQTDPKITYAGAWTHHGTSPAFGGSFHYTGTSGATATITFTGTSIELFGLTGPDWGTARVTVDSLPSDTVNFYSPGYVFQKSVYTKTGLPNTAHTLTFECLGTEKVDIDALRIEGILTQAPTPPAPTRFEQTDPKIAFAQGVWIHHATGPASGGSFHYTSIDGAGVNISFTGTSIELYGLVGPDWGKAQVTLDTNPAEDVSFYSPSYIFQRSVYFKGGLTDTPHTLNLKCTGQGNIDLDLVRVTGVLTQATAPPAPPIPPAPTYYQQNDPKVHYTEGWTFHPTGPASGGSFNYTGTDGASATMHFTGTAVELYALTGPDWGKARVTIDSLEPDYVDFYTAGYIFQRSVYLKSGLDNISHTLTIEWVSDKNPSSSGYLINIDLLRVAGYLDE